MRLKSLEIKGFKSFADKTVINLDNQITGIVGPNGCGKSNIVDAIRWVIGEHKIKTLRSDNLEDLIFNGSKTRNGSGLAEVALTFENTKNLLPTDFNTVTISRKFYKNGESEYRLNDVTCRLKDITNLFLDTGVTSDSYSIIELGMVDDIIKDKDNSRRRMLEQAAGISIYKTRKKEAKLKLDATQQDLNRIDDLLFEIANNLRTLESQAKKAEKYHSIKNEYKEVSVEFVKASLEDFNTSYNLLNEQQQLEVDGILALESNIKVNEAALEKEKLAFTLYEEELHTLQKNFNDLIATIQQLENNKQLCLQKSNHLNELIQNFQSLINESEKQTQLLQRNTTEADQKLITEEDTLQKLKSKLETLRTNLDQARNEYDTQKNKLDTIRSEHQQLQVKQFDAEKKVAIAESNINNIQRSINQQTDDIKYKTAELSEIDKTLITYKNNISVLSEQHTQLKTKQQEATDKLLSSQATLEVLRVNLFEENRKYDAKQNEYNLLKSLVDNLEGYPDSIKFLSKNKDLTLGNMLMSELFNVKDEYRKCIENYLDKYLNYYVVDDVANAYQAIDLLNNYNKGKAGFFILSALKASNENVKTPEGTVAAIDVISCKEKYIPLYKQLLQNVFIAENIQEIDAQNVVLLQKDGTSYKTTKRIVGGSLGVFDGNKIGRVERMEKLKNEIETLRVNVENIKNNITEIQNKIVGYNQDIKENEIKNTEHKLNEFNNKQIQLQHKHELITAQINQNKDRIAALQLQLEESKNAIADTAVEHSTMKQQLSLAFDHMQKSQETYKYSEAVYNKCNEEYNQQNIIITRQQSRINEIIQEKNIRKQQIEDLAVKIKQASEQHVQAVQNMDNNKNELLQIENQLLDLMKEKESKEKDLNIKDQGYYNMRNAINSAESELNKIRKEKEGRENALINIKDKLNEMKLQLASMKERLYVEFKVEIEDVLKQERTTSASIEELTIEVEKLKKRIENLGEVNPMAIDAYKEMKARHDFIHEQKNDLTSARDSLLQTIEEVEATANLKFLDTFEKVKENFKNVFHALFTQDDMCDMKLVDPENPAETTIEIYAQPKGKKPSTITQLSGGEKTLTSAAFLFAIYLIKPAPFCVLDEVDAPLDDANVGKFTNMIRRFSDNSQFIIVTHNKQTMASVDVIYGVTMQEAGVSKLVPVDFRSLN